MDQNPNAGMVDNRRFQRVRVNVPMQYRNLKKNSEEVTGAIAKNLCEGGICFKADQFISLACRLVVEISLPTSIKPIKAISKIAWIRKLPSGDQYELGNQFLEMGKEDRARISEFINNTITSGV